MILDLHRLALDGLSAYAGNFRPGDVSIDKSKHVPPTAHLVPSLIEDICDHVMDGFAENSALHLCAYVMWRLNWIHPFTDGTAGRCARAYYVLCAKVGYLLPGQRTVPEQIAADKRPHYEALERADRADQSGAPDLGAREMLLGGQLAEQLLAAYNDAHDANAGAAKHKKLH